jgi:small-conductance mechanosensitive channel
LKEPAPSVFLERFGDSSIDFKLMVWSSEMSDRPSRYRSDMNFAIAEKFREAGIEFPFPQRDVHIKDGVLKVENASGGKTTERSQA